MIKGHANTARAALAALVIFSFFTMPAAFGDVLFKHASLKIETKTGPVLLNIEVADTEAKREQGLMFRHSILADQGMIFLFDGEHEITMWMKNTYVSLDMIFIRSDWRIRHIVYDAEPFSTDVISSMRPASRVLEIGAGQAKRLGLAVGDIVALQK